MQPGKAEWRRRMLKNIWHQLIDTFSIKVGIVDVLDILVVAVLIYGCIQLVRQTHTAQLAKGILVLLVVYLVARSTGMRTLTYLIEGVMSFGLVALVVVFQPELRRALEQVGRTKLFGIQLFRPKADPSDMRTIWQNAVVAVCDAAENMSETRTGALMVLERRTNLSEIIKTGTVLDADITPEMLETIFYVGTPLHDGAVVVRDGRIEAAGCFLPLSNNLEIGKDMGTRHRAALGMSENSDAIVVVVSEETGIISLAKNGVLIRRLDRQNLFNVLEGDIVPPAPTEKKQPFWRKKHEKNK
jgi:diadenylate cyclase